MMLVFALIGFVGIILLMIAIICGLDPKTKHSNGWAIMFVIGLALLVVGWTGGLAIQDIEADAVQQEYEYEYNYCPHCGEQLKGE